MAPVFDARVIPVLVVRDAARAAPLGQALMDNGLALAEVTLRTPAAVEVIAALHELGGLRVGAGTVLNAKQAEAAVKAGAGFLVSPALHEDVIAYAQSANVPVVPGIATPSEIARAMALGLELVKFFPAEALGGVKLLGALGSVYPQMGLVPTGGIHPGNLLEYLALPNVVACGGSWMAPARLVDEGSFDEIGRLVREAVELSQDP